MYDITSNYLLYTIIFLFSVVQSIFGVGVLLFGTPTLIFLGYSYIETLWIVLPSSIVISTFQIIYDYRLICLKKPVFFFTLPAIIIGLVVVIVYEDSIDLSKIIGGGLLFVALIRISGNLREYLLRIIKKNIGLYYLGMGLVHGISNMGGGPLSVLMTSLYSDKDKIRSNVAYVYLLFGISQLAVLFIMRIDTLPVIYIMPPVISLVAYFSVGRVLSNYIDDNKYQYLITIFIFIYGVLGFIRFD